MNLYIDLNDNFVNLNETDFDIALRISTAPPQNYAMRKLVPVRWAYCASPGYLAKKACPSVVAIWSIMIAWFTQSHASAEGGG